MEDTTQYLESRGWLSAADPDFLDRLTAIDDENWARLASSGVAGELSDFSPTMLRRLRNRKMWMLTNGFEYEEERVQVPYALAKEPGEDGLPPVKQWTRVPAGICRTLEEALELERHRPTTKQGTGD